MTELNCVDIKAIQDWELEACADGKAPAHVLEHLKRCPACRARLIENLAAEHQLCQNG